MTVRTQPVKSHLFVSLARCEGRLKIIGDAFTFPVAKAGWLSPARPSMFCSGLSRSRFCLPSCRGLCQGTLGLGR